MSGRANQIHFNLYLSTAQHSGLTELAEAMGLSMAVLVRRGVDLLVAARHLELSGMTVKGFRADTTSGAVWLGRGV